MYNSSGYLQHILLGMFRNNLLYYLLCNSPIQCNSTDNIVIHYFQIKCRLLTRHRTIQCPLLSDCRISDHNLCIALIYSCQIRHMYNFLTCIPHYHDMLRHILHSVHWHSRIILDLNRQDSCILHQDNLSHYSIQDTNQY